MQRRLDFVSFTMADMSFEPFVLSPTDDLCINRADAVPVADEAEPPEAPEEPWATSTMPMRRCFFTFRSDLYAFRSFFPADLTSLSRTSAHRTYNSRHGACPGIVGALRVPGAGKSRSAKRCQ